jgi:hypothetical protein
MWELESGKLRSAHVDFTKVMRERRIAHLR